MNIEYDTSDGEQAVHIEHEGQTYTATRTVGSGENYALDDPTSVPLPVRQTVNQMNPEGINDPEPEEETPENPADAAPEGGN